MDLVIFEDNIKYDLGIKVVLALSLVLLIVPGILFYVDAEDSDIFPGEPAAESRTGSFVLFAAAVFLLAVYWLILPRTIAVSQEGLILRFRAFSWNIPFATIKSIKPASGIIVWWPIAGLHLTEARSKSSGSIDSRSGSLRAGATSSLNMLIRPLPTGRTLIRLERRAQAS